MSNTFKYCLQFFLWLGLTKLQPTEGLITDVTLVVEFAYSFSDMVFFVAWTNLSK